MKTSNKRFNLFAALVLLSGFKALAQTPPNDNFENRSVLTGSSVTFSGSLAGGTLEAGEPNGGLGGSFGATSSVWWTWTAPVSSAVVFSLVGGQPSYNQFAIYSGTGLNALTIQGFTYFAKPIGRYLRFDVAAGTTYQIQVIGSDTRPFSIQLTATNPPVFIIQPGDCTVSPYGSAFFSALASGPPGGYFYPGTSYQWFFNGTPIPRQTSPSLLVHGVTSNQAGTYSVIASNIGGITQGGSATLTVVDTNPVPRLAILPVANPNLLQFNLTGEPGRWYVFESSTNLQNWLNPVWLQLTNPTTLVSLPRLTPNHFVRASLDVPTEVCVAQLKQMQWATTLFTVENSKSETSSYSLVDLEPYAPLNSSGNLFPCPEGATYASGGTVTNAPTCTLHVRGHVIPDL